MRDDMGDYLKGLNGQYVDSAANAWGRAAKWQEEENARQRARSTYTPTTTSGGGSKYEPFEFTRRLIESIPPGVNLLFALVGALVAMIWLGQDSGFASRNSGWDLILGFAGVGLVGGIGGGLFLSALLLLLDFVLHLVLVALILGAVVGGIMLFA